MAGASSIGLPLFSMLYLLSSCLLSVHLSQISSSLLLLNFCTISACLFLCIYICLFLKLNDGILFCCNPVLASGLFTGVFVFMTLLPLLNHCIYSIFYVIFVCIMYFSVCLSLRFLHCCFVLFVLPAYLHLIAC